MKWTATRFKDRAEAGSLLAKKLNPYAHEKNGVVLALPRGGVPVAFEIANALELPLDVFVVRKLGVPGQEELAFGAISSGGEIVMNEWITNQAGLSRASIDRIIEKELREIERREALYRPGRPPIEIAGRTLILVDDGLATGATMRAAVSALRQSGPTRIVVAVPVASSEAFEQMSRLADECVCLATPDPFFGVGAWYDDFSQVSDDEVRELLISAERSRHQRRLARKV